METRLVCCEITQSALDGTWSGKETLGGFFQFGRYDRRFSDVEPLHDCHIYSLYPAERVSGWPQGSGPPDPSVFKSEFPRLIKALLPPPASLFLSVRAEDPSFFDEVSVMKATIKGLSSAYMLLSPVSHKNVAEFVGNLIFECPGTFLRNVAQDWFVSPIFDIEGYVLEPSEFVRIAQHYFEPDSVETIRKLLSFLKLGVRLWPDFNGLYIFSRDLDLTTVRSLLSKDGFELV